MIKKCNQEIISINLFNDNDFACRVKKSPDTLFAYCRMYGSPFI